jgi:hypothetical protein
MVSYALIAIRERTKMNRQAQPSSTLRALANSYLTTSSFSSFSPFCLLFSLCSAEASTSSLYALKLDSRSTQNCFSLSNVALCLLAISSSSSSTLFLPLR